MTATDKDKIAELEAKLKKLEADLTPTKFDAKADAKFRDELHQMNERRMSLAYMPSPSELRAYEAATPTDLVRGIVRDSHSPQGPSSAGKVSPSPPRTPPGGGTGWSEPASLAVPHVNHVDRLLDAQDERDRQQRVMEEARRIALQKAAKPK